MITVALTKTSSRKTKREKLRQALTKQLVQGTINEKGRGLIALADFSAGEVIAPIDGVHTWGGPELRRAEPGTVDEYSFVCEMPAGRYKKTSPIVASVGWHLANHSCSPNARLSDFVLAERRIQKGEEITVCYSWVTDRAASMTCLCAVPHCYGTVGARVLHMKTEEDLVKAWREYVDAMIVNRNAPALVTVMELLSEEGRSLVVQTNDRRQRIIQVLARAARPYNYDLPIERMESLSF